MASIQEVRDALIAQSTVITALANDMAVDYPVWSTGRPPEGDTVLFVDELDGYTYVGQWYNHYMIDFSGNTICHVNKVNRWVLLKSITPLILEAVNG